jgi:hypothetical protein
MSAVNIAVIFAAVCAFIGLVFPANDWWRRVKDSKTKSSGLLFIPEPPADQSPLEPVFWVYPPTRREDGSYDLVVAGEMFNAGPTDAYSVRIFAGPELEAMSEEDKADRSEAIWQAVERVIAPRFPERSLESLVQEFAANYKNRAFLRPLLAKGEGQRFVVVAHYDDLTPYLEQIAAEGDPTKRTRWWMHEGLQAHPVHAAERTALGHIHEFKPGDLCSPFEGARDMKARQQASA